MTAVEWLVDKILVENEVHTDSEGEWIDEPRIEYINAYKSFVDLSQYVKQAKEMEKEQIEKAYNSAVPFKYGKEYYEKTYKHQSNKESL
jgi:hypothetical protein